MIKRLEEVSEELNAIHEEVTRLLGTCLSVEKARNTETSEQRLDRARAETIARMGGPEAMARMQQMAIEAMYAEDRTLD